MKRILLIILALSFVLTPYAQKTAQRKKTATTARTVRTQKKAPNKKPVKRRQSKAPTWAEKKAAYSNASIRGLRGQRANIQKKIKEQERALRRNQADVKKRLQDLMVLNGEIDQRQKNIDGIFGKFLEAQLMINMDSRFQTGIALYKDSFTTKLLRLIYNSFTK